MKDKSTLVWLRKATNKYRPFVVVLTVFEIIVSGLGVCYALVMKQMVDRAVAKDSHGFVMGMIGFGLLVLSQLVIRVITRQMSEYTRSSMENTLKQNLFRSLLVKDYGRVSATHSEEWMNRLTSDTAVCAGGMTDILPGFLGMMIRLVGSLVLIIYLQPVLAFIMIPGGVIFLVITIVLRKPLKRFHKSVQEKDGQVRMYLQERISSMLVVRSFGVESIAVDQAADTMELHRSSRMRRAWMSNICNSGFSLAINGMYLLGIGYCGYGIINGSVTFGTLTAMIQLIGQLQSPLASLGGYVPRYYTTIASAERLMEVELYEDTDIEDMRSENEAKVLYKDQLREIVFDHISFQYPEEAGESDFIDDGTALHKGEVLSDISFTIRKGDYVAVTGMSGCGKSTVLKLLMGLYQPKAGRISVRLDDDKDITLDIPIKDMRRLFAYVPQGNFLMGGSIRDVIAFGKPQDDDRMANAICVACADFVYELPMKLDTVLGEKGAGLSEGQMQRVAIARALYTERPVLILDESTSALDQQTEETLLQNLKKLTDKTVLIVTHRPKALSICNNILDLQSFVQN